ncbi:Mu-like prophage major head subunit gpT family protein [Novosphingobium sp.]|uniref:Mu-like prophage major head subunit gpT family protein n=1 Tax=Novosphingobium sp. TaxID=1874826 RepID=UPI002633CDE1|nr:Mu-like prophage major head subunit gpT family protein [Novosphingobium sp.]
MIITGTALQTLGRSFNALYSAGLGTVQAQRDAIASTVPSTTKTNEYSWLGELPGMREWIGDRQVQQLKGHGYSIDNRDFEHTIEVKRTDIEDDNIGQYRMMFTAQGRAAAAHPEQLVWGALANGHTSLCYDGQYFFDTDHPVLDVNGAVQTVSNSLPGGGTPWFLIDDMQPVKPIIFQERQKMRWIPQDDPTNPDVFKKNKFAYGIDYRANVGYGFWQFAVRSTATLDSAGYEAARVALANMTGDYGRKIGARGRLLVVPASLEGAGVRLLNNQMNAAGASNEWAGTAKLLVSDWL